MGTRLASFFSAFLKFTIFLEMEIERVCNALSLVSIILEAIVAIFLEIESEI